MAGILLTGALGKMGRTLCSQVLTIEDLEVVAGVDIVSSDDCSFPVFSSFDAIDSAVIEKIDVIIDFSNPAALSNLLAFAVKHSLPVVIATTGLSDEQIASLHLAAEKIPVFFSANMSLGVNLLCELAKKAAAALGADFDITKRLTVTVRIKGNGRKGAVGIRLKSGKGNESGYGLLTVDTDFEGWRDFVLCEVDNGDRVELFEQGVHMYQIHHFLPNMFRFGFIEVLATGDVEGVRMSDIKACPQIYNVIKNPTLTVGGESVMFECELQSTDLIEWDGKRAVVIDRYANEKEIYFSGSLTVPKGKYKASLSAVSLNGCTVNAILTVGTEGKEIK